MFLKFCINFSTYLEEGANFKKLEKIQCFIFDYTSFLKFLCISKKNWEKKKKIIIILRQSNNDPARPLIINAVYPSITFHNTHTVAWCMAYNLLSVQLKSIRI